MEGAAAVVMGRRGGWGWQRLIGLAGGVSSRREGTAWPTRGLSAQGKYQHHTEEIILWIHAEDTTTVQLRADANQSFRADLTWQRIAFAQAFKQANVHF